MRYQFTYDLQEDKQTHPQKFTFCGITYYWRAQTIYCYITFHHCIHEKGPFRCLSMAPHKPAEQTRSGIGPQQGHCMTLSPSVHPVSLMVTFPHHQRSRRSGRLLNPESKVLQWLARSTFNVSDREQAQSVPARSEQSELRVLINGPAVKPPPTFSTMMRSPTWMALLFTFTVPAGKMKGQHWGACPWRFPQATRKISERQWTPGIVMLTTSVGSTIKAWVLRSKAQLRKRAHLVHHFMDLCHVVYI